MSKIHTPGFFFLVISLMTGAMWVNPLVSCYTVDHIARPVLQKKFVNLFTVFGVLQNSYPLTTPPCLGCLGVPACEYSSKTCFLKVVLAPSIIRCWSTVRQRGSYLVPQTYLSTLFTFWSPSNLEYRGQFTTKFQRISWGNFSSFLSLFRHSPSATSQKMLYTCEVWLNLHHLQPI